MIFPVKSPEITIYYYCITTIFWNFQDRPNGHCPGEKIAEAMRLDQVLSQRCPQYVWQNQEQVLHISYITSGASIHIGIYTYIYNIIYFMYIYIILGYIISISLLWGYLTTFLVRFWSCFTAAWQGQEVVLVRIAVTKLGLL